MSLAPLAPAVSVPHFIVESFYAPIYVLRMLLCWPWYHATGSTIPRDSDIERAAFRRHNIPTDGSFTAGSREYGDLEDATAHLVDRLQAPFVGTWRDDIMGVELARALERRDEYVRRDLWEATIIVMEWMTGERMDTYVKLWRERMFSYRQENIVHHRNEVAIANFKKLKKKPGNA